MVSITENGLNINGLILNPNISVEELESMGHRFEKEIDKKDPKQWHYIFTEAIPGDDISFRMEVIKSDSVAPDFIKITPHQNKGESGEELYEKSKRWLQKVTNSNITEGEYYVATASIGNLVIYLWRTIRLDNSIKCRSIRIYSKCTA
jgi:hypothetical protein